MSRSLGVWTVGALGGIGTTMAVGARAIARGLVSGTGLVTNTPAFDALNLVPIDALVFGGHEVREGDYFESAKKIYERSRSIDLAVIQELKDDLLDMSEALKAGTCVNAGSAIEELATNPVTKMDTPLRSIVQQIQSDLRSFRAREGIDDVVVVNLASTEPDLPEECAASDAAAFEVLLDQDQRDLVRPSMLYAYAAFKEGCGYINFTPSAAALSPVMQTIGEACSVPFMGNDGKTGETLVKSALAPMFKYRNLQVLSWQGYNMLGDRDGKVLSSPENLATKVRSKDSVLQGILGYPVHTHVGIDFVESLDDLKTAWDFIHFQGFLDHKMSMQFTWQGCDAILAAPLVLDMIRLTDLAMRRGESGPMRHLAPYFKSPLGVEDHDLHQQFHGMMDYLAGLGLDNG
ncbi:MAG: inositol-3-phosphate synthase [Planctomycetota bacterium]|nr:inositol-3-phosphate synthase [Planctomycetota bacterium]